MKKFLMRSCSCNEIMKTTSFEWDETKNLKNVETHKLDFIDADLVFENPKKVTVKSAHSKEERFMDLAEVHESVLVLVYTYRQDHVRIMSFRPASRKERGFYHDQRKNR